MLHLLGIIIGFIFIIVFVSNDMKEDKKALSSRGRVQQQRGKLALPLKQLGPRGKKQRQKDISENDLQVMATILSMGLVDVDPSSLKQLKELRDLRGSST